MAWLGLDKLFLGTDLTAEQQRSNELDAKIAQANQRLVDQGVWTQTQYDQAQQDISSGNQSTGADNVVQSVDMEAKAGLQEGLNNVLDAPGKVVGAVGSGLSQTLGGILKNIPWWVYLVGLGALFVWMGGLSLLRGRLGRQ
jgi:multidrug efflux pump subunit AcrA (membrane-fusion protein)